MLRLLLEQEDALSLFCEKDVFGTRIAAYYNTYCMEYSYAVFYLQENELRVTAALCKIDEKMTVCCEDGADFEELVEFIKAIRYESMMCDARVCDKLKLEPIKTGSVVEFKSKQDATKNKDICFVNRFELSDIYGILNRSNFDGLGEKLQWLSDVSLRVKRGTAKAAAIEEFGEKVACAMILFETEKAALIGAVATIPEYRGKGYAGALVTSLAEYVKSGGKRAELLCARGSIIEFYNKLGFVKTGDWALV